MTKCLNEELETEATAMVRGKRTSSHRAMVTNGSTATESLQRSALKDLEPRISTLHMHEFPKNTGLFICGDVMVCILSALPVRSIVRFKRVSKSWKQLLSSPFFIQFHYLKPPSSSDPSAILTLRNRLFSFSLSELEACSKVPMRELMFGRASEEEGKQQLFVRLSASSHGLVCFIASTVLGYSLTFCVCNPMTREFFTHPRLRIRDPGKQLVLKGFGFQFDPHNQTFKILLCAMICGMAYSLPIEIQYHLFDSSTRLWKRVLDPPLDSGYPISPCDATYLCTGGACYEVFINNHFRRSVAIFDMDKEVWEIIALPLQVAETLSRLSASEAISCKLVSWRKKVCFIHAFGNGKLGIWSLSEEKKWKQVTIEADVGNFTFLQSRGRNVRPGMDVILQQHALLVSKKKARGLEIYLHKDFKKSGGVKKIKWPYGEENDSFINIIPYEPSLFSCKFLLHNN
ncbi:F-box only protein 8 [Amborella trichopoda]|uniref:F-box domain-containing protein n=1 Tax=Amborella trichopoda TaxID=13333 RepID=W1NSG8_AMBTC|nr:F-box only protein 8 [Amborella trichopoda]ERM97799.1 hypothetical protein AMTR_s00116p00138190 [Amborella trichopoda]|eukprot:XP_006830383.1 F-box only protein 8 [Amborella trichopoda]